MKKLSPHIIFIWLAAVLTALVFFPKPGSCEVVDRIVAVVNEDIILLSELEAVYRPYAEKIKSSDYPPEKERQMLYRVRQDLIDKMVEAKLTEQEVEANKLTVSAAEVDQMIERIKEANYYTDEEFRKALELGGMTPQAYRDELKDQILRNKLVTMEVKSKIVITKADIQTYYNAHPELYGGKKQVRLRNIFLKFPTDSDQGPTAAINELFAPIINRLETGESFEALAREFSQSSSAADGGDLGLFSIETLSDQIRNHIEDLTAGQYTPVLESANGGQIIMVEEIVNSGGKSLEEVSAEIEQKLFKDIMDKKFAEWMENLRSRSHIKIIR